MTGKNKVTVVIPALNEAESIGAVIREIPVAYVDEVIVVDNDSTDDTAQIAAREGVRVVKETRRGYGAACYAGYRAARRAEVIIFMDGDHSDCPEELPRLLAPILEGKADLVMGSRLKGLREPLAMAPHAVAGNWLVSRLVRLLLGVKVSDIPSFRAIRGKALADLKMQERTYGWPVEMIVKAAKKGYRVMEVPVTHRRRMGKSKVGGTLRGSLLAAYYMVVTLIKYSLKGSP